jgi:hypothetical protein
MVACDSSECRLEWFHFACVGLYVKPKGKWYCEECRVRMRAQGVDPDQLQAEEVEPRNKRKYRRGKKKCQRGESALK